MRNPFSRTPEVREQSSYTDTLVSLLVAQAEGKQAKATATAAVEMAAGLVARSFASADVDATAAVRSALTPACLHLIGRSLIRRGEFVARIEMGNAGLRLTPAADWDVRGGPNPDTWRYRLNMAGPSDWGTHIMAGAGEVVHVCFAVDAGRPWRGVGPLQSATLAGRLSAETVAALGDEASGPRGHYVPQPNPGDSPNVAQIATDTSGAKGAVLFVESQAGDHQRGGRAPSNDWQPNRFGANPPDGLVNLNTRATEEILAACGVSPALFGGSDGTALRESYRQFLFGTIAPLGKILQAELAAKFGTDIALSWSELRAADITGRARAFQSMVASGMDAMPAAALSGLLIDGEPPTEAPADDDG